MCHCEEGYKGGECEIPAGECQVPGCSGHGRCIEGECHCERGFKGNNCSERKCFFSIFFLPHTHQFHIQIYENYYLLQLTVWIQLARIMAHASMGNASVSFKLVNFKSKNLIIFTHTDTSETIISFAGKAGWQGEDCSTVDQQVYQCLPGCSEKGTYDLETGTCICDRHWTGPDCSQGTYFFYSNSFANHFYRSFSLNLRNFCKLRQEYLWP